MLHIIVQHFSNPSLSFSLPFHVEAIYLPMFNFVNIAIILNYICMGVRVEFSHNTIVVKDAREILQVDMGYMRDSRYKCSHGHDSY